MYVGFDKAAAVRMFALVQEAWEGHLAELRAERDALPELERPWLASRIELMETTDMAVVVSQSQNELKTLDDQGLDIRPHRERMNREDLAEEFKDAANPLRLVFACAMWMTGFYAPSVSTVYLDRPMKNHTLMQTIARANRVFHEKDNGLIVDYVGALGNLEKALAIDGAASAGESPIEIIDALAGELDAAVAELTSFCANAGVDLPAMPIVEVTRLPEADISSVSDAVDALLDRSVGAEEYVIRASAEGANPDPLIDLSLIDFDGPTAKFVGRRRAETDRLAQVLRQQAIGAALPNPTRYELVERIEQLIEDYNAGSVNIDEYLRRLIELSQALTTE